MKGWVLEFHALLFWSCKTVFPFPVWTKRYVKPSALKHEFIDLRNQD